MTKPNQVHTCCANEVRSTGPTWDHWPASLPRVAYVCKDGAFLCVTCANGGNGSLATTIPDDGDPSNAQWQIIGAQVNDRPEPCAHCGRMIQPEVIR